MENGLTQSEFARRIGLSQAAFSSIEIGTRSVQERYIISICAEFHVSEQWLRTGEGDMYADPADQLVRQLADQYHLSGVYLHVVRAFLTIPPEFRGEILTLARALVLADEQSASPASSPPASPAEDPAADPMAIARSYMERRDHPSSDEPPASKKSTG